MFNILKEKCIYYNPKNKGYYLVLVVKDMIYGRYGNMMSSNYLESYMNQETGLRFKIDDIVINMEYYRNYQLDDEEINDFVLVKELTDEEFYPISILINSNYRFPAIIIGIHKHMKDVVDMVAQIKNKEAELLNLKREVHGLHKQLYLKMMGE